MARTITACQQAIVYLEILRCMSKKTKRTAKEIRSMLQTRGIHIESQTVQRYLKSLSESDPAYIERDDSSKPFGYRFKNTAETFTQNLTIEESLVFKLVQEHLRYQLPARLFKNFSPLFESAQQKLDSNIGKISNEGRWTNKVAVVPNSLPFMPPVVKPRIFEAVSQALFENRQLEIEYRNAKGERKTHIVNPLGIVQQDPRLYLVCNFVGHTNERHIALHRILNATKLSIEAQGSERFKIANYVASRHFNYTTDEKHIVRLTLVFNSPETKLNLEESPFNRTQTITIEPDGTFKLQVVIEDSLLLDGWINTWRDRAGIVSVQKELLESVSSKESH